MLNYSSVKIDSDWAARPSWDKKKSFQLDDNRVTRGSGC